jgi:hypothetical protein
LTAVYSGDATFNTSTSTAEPHQVGPVCPTSVIVTDAGDAGPNTLRQALLDVCDGGTITFNLPPATTITLATAELHVTKNVTITGPGSGNLAVNGASAFRIFEVDAAKTVNITGIALNNGKVAGANGGAGAAGSPALGGGVFNAGTLTLSDVIVNNCQAKGGAGGDNSGAPGGNGGDAFGGGISNSGTLNLTNSTLSANSAVGGKGGDSDTTAGTGGAAVGGGVYNTGILTGNQFHLLQ